MGTSRDTGGYPHDGGVAVMKDVTSDTQADPLADQTAVARPQLEVVGRVTSRRRHKKQLVFLDLVVPRSVEHAGQCFFKVELKLESEDEAEQLLHRDIHPGDVIRASGCFYEDDWGQARSDVIDIRVDTFQVLEKWAVLNDKQITCLFDKKLEFPSCSILQRMGTGASTVVLQVNNVHVDRLQQYFRDVYGGLELERSVSGMHSSDWVLALPEGMSWPANDPLLNGPNTPVHRVYVVNSLWATLEDALTELRNLVTSQRVERLRIATFPSKLQQPVIQHPCMAGIELDPKSYTHYASVVYFHGGFAVGVDPNPPLIVGPTLAVPAHICKAYYKMEEVCLRMKWGKEQLAGKTALDVGASPGGWSWYLAEVLDMGHVFAIDPGALDLPRPVSRIEHMPMLGLMAIPSLVEQGTRAALYVCDANVYPTVALDMLLEFKEDRILREGSRVIVTLKNGCKNKAEWKKVYAEQFERFRSLCPDVREIHLFANTMHETTLVGQIPEA